MNNQFIPEPHWALLEKLSGNNLKNSFENAEYYRKQLQRSLFYTKNQALADRIREALNEIELCEQYFPQEIRDQVATINEELEKLDQLLIQFNPQIDKGKRPFHTILSNKYKIPTNEFLRSIAYREYINYSSCTLLNQKQYSEINIAGFRKLKRWWEINMNKKYHNGTETLKIAQVIPPFKGTPMHYFKGYYDSNQK